MPQSDYKDGENIIVYRAKNFGIGITVTAKVFSPDMVEDVGSPFTLTEVSNGLYKFSFTFQTNGIYHAIIFENGTETAYQPLRVGAKISN